MNLSIYKLLFGILFLYCSLVVSAQPLPCENPPTMTPLCADACIICDIDGFTGVNNGGASGEAPDDFCTSTVHNGRWIAFIAGSEELVIRLSVANCQRTPPKGLELGMYEGNNCSNFNLVTECDGSIDENTSAIFTTNTPLTIGQYYYIVMDGNHGDVCEWTFNVLEGSTKVNPLETSGIISGDVAICANRLAVYSTTAQVGATEFLWTVDGNMVQNNGSQTLELEWENEGTYEICVTASNACDEAPPTCETIIVKSVSLTSLEEVICVNETFVVGETNEVDTPGNHAFTLTSSNGCDSLVQLSLEVYEPSFVDLEANVCEGESFLLGSTPLFTAGEYIEVLTSMAGCDSTVTVDLSVVNCNMEGSISSVSVVCLGESTGRLNFTMTSGTPPFNYTWEQLGTTTMGSGVLTNLDDFVSIINLLGGNYLVTIEDLFGNSLELNETIEEESTFTATLEVMDFNGANISCFDAADGRIMAVPSGGVLPYQYSWNTGENGVEVIEDLTGGIYTVTVADDNGCEVVLNQELIEPSPLELEVLFTNPNCEDFSVGELEVVAVNGGTNPYLFAPSNGDFGLERVFPNLSEGTYTLTVRDANGCEADTTVMITTPIVPTIDLGEDRAISLGEQVNLDIISNISLENLSWYSTGALECVDCPSQTLQPFSTTTYTAELASIDGCVARDSVTVFVEERRQIAIPNAFSPNQDGVNDNFMIFGGPEVSHVHSFQVFSRWGEKVFEQFGFQPNDAKFGWNGTYKLRSAQNGVYVWWAEIEFVDGLVEIYKGNVTLLR